MTTTHDVPMPEPAHYIEGFEYSGSIGRHKVRVPCYTADQLRAYADARCAKLQAELDALAERGKAMEDDARRVFRLYGSHWDRADGGLFVDESDVPEFDAAFEALGVRLGLLVEDNEGDAAIDAAGG